MTTWIDFKELRQKLRFSDVFAHYNVPLKIRGDRASGFCPLPTHQSKHSDGKQRSPSFSANLSRGIFQCFGCGAKGNILDFGCRMEGFDPADPAALRQGALKLAEIFGLESEHYEKPAHTGQNPAPVSKPSKPPPEAKSNALREQLKRRSVNEPIDFELKHLNPAHPHLAGRGFAPETISHFGLGFCSRGLMKDRIAIPIHDPIGRLVAYAGRLVDDDKVDAENPKYRFPGEREREGVIHEFRKSLLAYNLHRLGGKVKDLIVVEGFPSVWWLHQHGYKHVVALMGSSCSPEQASLIAHQLENDGRIWLMSDGDEAGERLASQALPLLAAMRFTHFVKLGKDRQPTDVGADELKVLLNI